MRSHLRQLGSLTRYLAPAVLLLNLTGCSSENPRVTTRINREASLPAGLPLNPFAGKVIASWVDKKDSAMSTLFGNDVATHYIRTNAKSDYPPGSVLSLVTWQQQEDLRWFGGRIPAALRSVEFVSVRMGADGHILYAYRKYTGSPLKEVMAQEDPAPDRRSAYLLAQRAAVMP